MPGGADQTTSYTYDTGNRLSSVTEPSGVSESFTYDPATGQRASTTVSAPGSASVVTDDYYQAGRLAYQTDGSGTLLASYTYDVAGVPVSVQVGSDPATAPRYYYVYDARGDVANLTDVAGNVVASYRYDTWGNLTSSSETIPNAGSWTNPYRFDGRDGVQSDPATGLDWMATRAYDPTTGRFISRDPLGRAPLYFADNPYVYAGNDPVSNIDPSGQYRAAGFGSTQRESGQATSQQMVRIQTVQGTSASANTGDCGGCAQVKPNATPPPTAHDGYGCVVGDHACDAQQMAYGDMAVWGIMGGALLLLGAAMTTLGASIPFVGAAIAAAGAAFLVAGTIAGAIGLLFAVEGGHPEAWYDVRANVTVFASQVETVLVALTALTAIIANFLVAIPPVAIIAGAVKLVSLALGIGFSALFRQEMDAQEQALGYL